MTSFYSLSAKTLSGAPFLFEQLKNKVVVVVNVASKCGFTPQYAGLEALYKKYKDSGVVVIGIPCNQFKAQEPGSSEEIASFCQLNYGVTFPILEKSIVNSSDSDPEISPIYAHLKSQSPGDIKWNFEKYLINKNGVVVKHCLSRVSPEELHAEIDKLL